MDLDAGNPEARTNRSARFHLWSALAIALSLVFVTLVAVFTGDLMTFWPLFVVPILIAATAYEVPGAIAASAVSALVVALLLPDLASGALKRSELLIGIVTFLACGVVVGMQSVRARRHALVLEQSSVRDPETGLYKPSFMRSRLAEEVRRGARHDVAVSLLLIRVDDLSRFRSTFGGYKASLLLEHMADILRIAVRDTDIVGRHSEDMFCALLPFAEPAEAASIASRVQEAVCGAEFEGDVLEPATRCTVTVSSASYPVEASDDAALVGLAEKRLAVLVRPEVVTVPGTWNAGVTHAGEAGS
jgi:diguanylate cyclase (GGDEF)-like protein